ncbi:Gag polyprotein [Labeo rohita]|uniref:Gag polyprotein n=1 Tax=Labeo rohita TaxID=84645 RepID=A0ABQ8MX34_LABRO|nr:Gag polyprotein [Labeo rohita]
MAESPQNNCYGSALRPTTERHGTEPPNVTIDQMLDNLNVYLDKRLGLRKCHDDMCQRYSIKHSESGQWALSDIKRAYGKTQRLWTNTKKDGLSVVLVKQILQHLQKCETDKQQHETKAEKAKVRALAEELQIVKEDKERLLHENDKLLSLLSKRLESKSSSSSVDSDDESSINTCVQATRNTKVRLAPVIVKNRWTEVEIDSEKEYMENGERQTRTVKKLVKKYVPYRTYQPATPEQVDKWSKELPDVYKQPRRVWQFLQRLQKIYNLHPLDGVMIVNVNLRDNDQKRLTESVERKIGESQENIEDGWEAVQTFLFELKPVEVNWAKITSCMQKTGESVAEFEERFRQTWMEHAGVNNNSEDLKDTSMPLKATFVNGLKPEISEALKIKYDDWDSTATTFIQIVEWSAKIERAQDVKLRALQSKTLYNNRTTGYEKAAGKLKNLSLQHQLATSHPKAYGLHVYVNKTSEDTIEKGKAYTETSTTEAKDDVLEGSAAKQAVKERGPHTAALRQLKLHRQQDSQPMSSENPTSDSLVQTDERLSLAVHNAKNHVLTPPKRDHGVPAFQRMCKDIQRFDCTALSI